MSYAIYLCPSPIFLFSSYLNWLHIFGLNPTLSVPDGFGRFPDVVPAAQVPEEGMPAHIRGEISEPIKFAQMTNVSFLRGKLPNACARGQWERGRATSKWGKKQELKWVWQRTLPLPHHCHLWHFLPACHGFRFVFASETDKHLFTRWSINSLNYTLWAKKDLGLRVPHPSSPPLSPRFGPVFLWWVLHEL